ncbi:MAG: histidine phosphatase family protein [Lachnospiraceae bacterium]|nr:histidine phosphatase family protein [Lachnospiraceae bacterium]MBQ6993785.1 histidine phosphatase family protein [Lachnospiraceae bacterium]
MWNRTENQIKLILIRHGETAANKEHRYLGRTDETLSIEGKENLLQYEKQGKYPKADMVFISPMKRCKETAQLLYATVTTREIPEWTEMDFGDFEGKNYTELQHDERYQAWIDSNGTMPFPNGESREMFIRRCMQGMDKFIQSLYEEMADRKIENVAAVVHGGTIMALLSSICGGEYFDYQVKNGEGFVCSLTLERGKTWSITLLHLL